MLDPFTASAKTETPLSLPDLTHFAAALGGKERKTAKQTKKMAERLLMRDTSPCS
jgi:hypothetical protein